MLTMIIVGIVFFLLGGGLGWTLARQGITADNALQRHQKWVYRVGCGLLGLGVLIAIAGRSPWIPNLLLLLIGGYAWETVLAIASFSAGFFLLLELPGWKDSKRLTQLILFLLVSTAAAAFLIYERWPIINLLQAPQISKGVILQTTPSSCSAAAIATLARIVHPQRAVTEREVVELEGTSRMGASTISEILAMERLGLAPQFERNLNVKDLVARQQQTVLHVMEPVAGTQVLHAVALLSIDPVKRTLTLGNPLYGRQVKSFDEMKNYWLGEAIFVTRLETK